MIGADELKAGSVYRVVGTLCDVDTLEEPIPEPTNAKAAFKKKKPYQENVLFIVADTLPEHNAHQILSPLGVGYLKYNKDPEENYQEYVLVIDGAENVS